MLKSTSFVIFFGFLGIKAVLFFSFSEWLNHLLIASILLILPWARGELQLGFWIKKAVAARRTWADTVCLLFLLTPLLLNLSFYSEQWHQTSRTWIQWIFSQSGICSILIAPLVEEIFFRGWLLDKQCAQLSNAEKDSNSGVMKICYLNALIFWAMHLPLDFALWRDALVNAQIPSSPGPFLLGFVCCFLTLRVGHLRSAVIFHAIANAAGPLWWPLLENESVRKLFFN